MDEGTPRFRYDVRLANDIEPRWQDRWEREGTFQAPNPAAVGRPKFYLLDFFPYPSGIGLHVGHPLGYIGTDVFGRYLRMTGHQVLHPFGFDTFGLPAEQYAIDTGQHPAVTVQQNAAVMRRQLRRLGLGHDRRREILTSDPSFYRGTQWIFLQIFNCWFDPDAGPAGRARPVGEGCWPAWTTWTGRRTSSPCSGTGSARAADRTACGTGCSPGSGTGGSRSRSCTTRPSPFPRPGRSRCQRRCCRSLCQT